MGPERQGDVSASLAGASSFDSQYLMAIDPNNGLHE